MKVKEQNVVYCTMEYYPAIKKGGKSRYRHSQG